MKKRNVAVAMAAMTMATSVAPVVANALETDDSKSFVIENKDAGSLVSKVRDLLKAESNETKAKSLYTIYTNLKVETTGVNKDKLVEAITQIEIDGKKISGVTGNKITDVKQLAEILDLASKGEVATTVNDELEVTIIDNGFAEVNGKKVTTIIPTYDNVVDLKDTKDKIRESIVSAQKKLIFDNNETTQGTIGLTLGSEFTEEVYDVKFDKKTGEITVDLYNDLDMPLDQVKAYIEKENLTGLEPTKTNYYNTNITGLAGDETTISSTNSNKLTGVANDKVYKEVELTGYDKSNTNFKLEIKGANGRYTDANQNLIDTTKGKKITTIGEYRLTITDTRESSNPVKLTFSIEEEQKEYKTRVKTTFNINRNDEKIKDDLKFVVDGEKNPVEIENIFKNGTAPSLTDMSSEEKLTRMSDIEGFEIEDAQDIESKELAKVRITNSNLGELETSQLFDGMMLTEKGVELLKTLNSTKIEDGVKTTITIKDDSIGDVEEVEKDKEYKLEFKVNKTEELVSKTSSKDITPTEDFELTIKSDNEEKLEKLRDMLDSVKIGGFGSVQSIRTLEGSTRFETAIEVSKELYPANEVANSAESIVLVQKDAVVDGLAATPLAKMAEAPILFTDKTSVPTKVMSEIKRALNIKETAVGQLKDKVIYIIGGTNVIEPAVEEQLKEVGVTVKRIDGANRMETSVNIAEEMKTVARKKGLIFDDKAFVVGRNGEADAMSIAGYAAQNNSPIIVADTNELTKSAVDFIEDEMKTADIIGGKTVVKEEIEDKLVEILDAKTSNVERVEGLRRSETNANVINKYYKGADLKTIYVAKNGQGNATELVDSLVAGPLAAKKHAPVVLATNELSEEQSIALDVRLSGNESLVQVGGGVSRTIIEKIAVKLGLIK